MILRPWQRLTKAWKIKVQGQVWSKITELNHASWEYNIYTVLVQIALAGNV